MYRVKLHEVYRCKDPAFNKILGARPCAKTLRWLQSKKAWTPPTEPTVEGIRLLFRAHPTTMVLTCARNGMKQINDLALEAMYPIFPPLEIVPGDLESNPDNYTKGELHKDAAKLEPSFRAHLQRYAIGTHQKWAQASTERASPSKSPLRPATGSMSGNGLMPPLDAFMEVCGQWRSLGGCQI